MGPDGNRRAPVLAKVAYGEAEAWPDPARPVAYVPRVSPVAASVDVEVPET